MNANSSLYNFLISILIFSLFFFFFFNDTATTEIYTLSLHDALPIYRVLGITSVNDRGCWPKRFFAEHRHLWCHISHDGRSIKIPLAFQRLSSQQHACAHLDGSLHLPVQRVAQVAPRHRSDLCLVLEWIAYTQLRRSFYELALKCLSNRLDDDEALGRDAALPIILEAGRNGDLCRLVQVRICQHNESI